MSLHDSSVLGDPQLAGQERPETGVDNVGVHRARDEPGIQLRALLIRQAHGEHWRAAEDDLSGAEPAAKAQAALAQEEGDGGGDEDRVNGPCDDEVLCHAEGGHNRRGGGAVDALRDGGGDKPGDEREEGEVHEEALCEGFPGGSEGCEIGV